MELFALRMPPQRIAEKCGISRGTALNIVNERLGLSKPWPKKPEKDYSGLVSWLRAHSKKWEHKSPIAAEMIKGAAMRIQQLEKELKQCRVGK